MSICSDVYISLDEARRMVKVQLLAEQEKLVEQAVKGMDKWELSHRLNHDSDIYYYNIESEEDNEDN